MDVHLLRELLRDLVLPPGGQLLLIVAGWWCLARRRRVGQALLGLGIASLWLLATPAVADRIEYAIERYRALDLAQPTGAQAVVILAAGSRHAAPEYGADAPDMETLQRLAYGALVARRTDLPILVSGGRQADRISLAAIMRDALERDFATHVRWLEDRSRDTHENAVYSASLLRADGVQRVILVTTANHMARAVAEFQATGMSVVPAPQGGLPKPQAPRARDLTVTAAALARSKWALYEALGEWVRRLRSARR
jgi:uncharacterized SAM-binding protein YcdF (DUF218 family)